MKKFLFLIILGTLASRLAIAQQQLNLGSYALHGNVKLMKLKDGGINKGDTSFLVDDNIFFNPTGKLQHIVHNKPFTAAAEDYQYDPQGRLQSIAKYLPGGKLYETWAYKYTGEDSTYTITATTEATGHVNQRQSFVRGKMVSVAHYYTDTVKNDWSTLTYDQHGRLISEVVFYHRMPSYHNSYKYPNAGKDNTDSFYDKSNKLNFTEERYYDLHGRKIHTLAHFPDGRFLKEVFITYNAHGDQISSREVDGIYNLTWNTVYEYDAHGNWTKRHIYTTTGKHREVLTFRDINYY